MREIDLRRGQGRYSDAWHVGDSAEVKTGNRRVLEFLLDPLMEVTVEASH